LVGEFEVVELGKGIQRFLYTPQGKHRMAVANFFGEAEKYLIEPFGRNLKSKELSRPFGIDLS